MIIPGFLRRGVGMADKSVSKTDGGNPVRVQVPSPADSPGIAK